MINHLGQYFLLLLLAGALVLTYFIFEPFLTALILAGVFAVVLQPVYQRALMLLPRFPSIASLVTVLFSIACILLPLAAIGTQIALESADLYVSFVAGDARQEVASVLHRIEDGVTRYVPQFEGTSERMSANVSSYAEVGLTWLLQHIGVAFSGIASIMVSLFIFFVALYYLLRDGVKLKQTLIVLSPLSDAHDETVFARLEMAVNSVIRGNLTIAFTQGVLSAIGFSVFGVPNPVLWGTVTAIAALIPGVGTGLVFAPVVVFMFVTDHALAALGLSVWGVLAVGLIDNFLAPQLIGSGTNLHPLLVLLSVLGGITLFGAVGIFLGPLSLSLLFALISIYTDITRSKV